MKILSNIKTKVWSCVWIALLAYLFATIATSISNSRINTVLTHIEEVHFPLSLKGERAFTLFKEQTKHYESALLTGDEDELVKANQLNDEIASLLNELIQTTSRSHKNFYPLLLSLRDSYEDYFLIASEQYLAALRSPDPFSITKEMRRIGKVRDQLRADFQRKSLMLTETVVQEIGNSKQSATNNSRLLQALFVAVLVIITIVINLIANRQLILPLKKLRQMIENFARGKSIERPEICDENDEICTLARSFWDMTEKLKKISVSKDYVDNIINNMSDSLIVLSPSLTIQRINQSTKILLDYEENELLDQPIQQILSRDEESSTPQTLFNELCMGKSISSLEMTFKTNTGNHLPVLFSGTPLYDPDGSSIQGIVCLIRDISQFKKEIKKREIRINYDPLTNLPNRNLFLDRLHQSVGEAKRYQQKIAFFIIDIDLFSSINETLGHETGNQILQEAAERLKKSVRETDTVARMKGDEFAVLLNRINGPDDADIVARKIIENISQPFPFFGTEIIAVSIGISLFPKDGVDGNTLLKNADCAMYEAKSQGGNRYLFYNEEIQPVLN
ncbi:MAG: diguanylate cyclase [Desulfobulbaceae bacterium]|nr:diguanylate cyclase [Desulfobulbaceae bacterium]